MLDENGIIKVANVGDCGLRIIRKGNTIHVVSLTPVLMMGEFGFCHFSNVSKGSIKEE